LPNSVQQAKILSWAIATKKNRNFFNSRNNALLLLQGSKAINDPTVAHEIISALHNSYDLLNNYHNLENFVHSFSGWILDHSTNVIIGLDQFEADFSAGTTQSFDSFYLRYPSRRMRCFSGEYFYHIKSWLSLKRDWSFVSSLNPLKENDALVISVPFCDTGNIYSNLSEILQECCKLNIPVLLDCCYYTISSNIHVDLQSPCIDTVAFSLSKAFPIANLRIGVRYTRKDTFDGQKLHHSINYNNSLSAGVGLHLIQKFKSDYISNKYKDKQKLVCNTFNIAPSNSVIFAVGNNAWSCYNRSNLLKCYQLDLDPNQFKNRISLSSIFDNWDIFEKFNDTRTTL